MFGGPSLNLLRGPFETELLSLISVQFVGSVENKTMYTEVTRLVPKDPEFR